MQTIGVIKIFGIKYVVLVRMGKTFRSIKLPKRKIKKAEINYYDKADGEFLENHPNLYKKFLKGEVIKL